MADKTALEPFIEVSAMDDHRKKAEEKEVRSEEEESSPLDVTGEPGLGGDTSLIGINPKHVPPPPDADEEPPDTTDSEDA